MYTFGSLLLRDNDDKSSIKEEYWKKVYQTKLAFKNTSPFPIKLLFEFENLEIQEEVDKKNKKNKCKFKILLIYHKILYNYKQMKFNI